jgi:hypothetical protein
MASQSTETCSWCDNGIDPGDGWRLQEVPGARRAAFCRLEHVVPWALRGAHWDPGEIDEPSGVLESAGVCSRCEQPLTDVRLLLVRHRGQHRIPDAFCSVDHLGAWAKAGGRWR